MRVFLWAFDMLTVNVRSDSRALLKALKGNQKQISIATSIALTKTAKQIQREEVGEMKRVFDRPTQYTLNGLYIKPSTKTNLEARIGIKNDVFKGTPAEKYLLPNIIGGQRKLKRFERAFIAKGIMPEGYNAVPGAGAKLDNFGNVPAKFIVQILSFLGAFSNVGFSANSTQKTRDRFLKTQAKRVGGANVAYFVVNTKSRIPMGIYQRTVFGLGSSIKPIFVFVKSSTYNSKFNFLQKADEVNRKFFPLYLAESVQQSLQYL